MDIKLDETNSVEPYNWCVVQVDKRTQEKKLIMDGVSQRTALNYEIPKSIYSNLIAEEKGLPDRYYFLSTTIQNAATLN